MGHLISRAFKRLTQGGQSRSQPSEPQNDREQQDKGNNNNLNSTSSRNLTESIPVGQSIDSAEYAALDTSDTRTRITTTTTTTAKIDPDYNDGLDKVVDTSNTTATENEKQGVEEAVIKIQALVRGHLTRKALKDAHHNSVPPPNALGQSQFDENSLLRDAPSAVFSQLTRVEETQEKQPVTSENLRFQGSNGSESQRASLDPIVEVPVGGLNNIKSSTTTPNQPNTSIKTTKNDEERKKLSLICSRSASSPSQLETPRTDSMNRDSLSPVPSEANASIDLHCDTPASASIDIVSSNIIPTGNIASVLHHKLDDCNDRAHELAEAAVGVVDDDDYDDVAQVEIGYHGEGEPSNMRLTVNENGVCGTPDSLESEEAAAIRIQSAFRGYRTRKNSPYRSRSPNTTVSKRNALIQQEATILDENDGETAARLSNEAVELASGVAESAETSVLSGSVLPSEERRSSRVRQRDCSEIEKQQQQLNQRVPPADEFTTTEENTTQTSTVKSMLGQHQESNESAVADDAVKSDGDSEKGKEVLIGAEIEEPSFSMEVEESELNTLDELGLSSALETAQTTTSLNTNGNNKVPIDGKSSVPNARPSIGSKSQTSVETYDTDSSVLGAALSLNDDLSVTDPTRGSETTAELRTPALGPALGPIDEEKAKIAHNMQTDNEISKPNEPKGGVLEGGALVEDDMAAKEVTNVINEQEQRAIEMESDDIERRDPRGQVSEERAKSPQIRLDEPQFAISKAASEEIEGGEQENDEKNKTISDVNDNLSPRRGDESGHSTPAPNSSAANSSSEDDSDQAQRAVQSPGGDDSTKKQQQSAKSRKKNNRNKRKGKK